MSAHPTCRGPEDTAQLAHAVLAKLNAFKADTPNLGEVRGFLGRWREAPARVRVKGFIPLPTPILTHPWGAPPPQGHCWVSLAPSSGWGGTHVRMSDLTHENVCLK